MRAPMSPLPASNPIEAVMPCKAWTLTQCSAPRDRPAMLSHVFRAGAAEVTVYMSDHTYPGPVCAFDRGACSEITVQIRLATINFIFIEIPSEALAWISIKTGMRAERQE